MITFAPFEPDRSVYSTDATTAALNVLPVRDGWGPAPGLTVISDALGAECLGAIVVRTSGGAYYVIAGTATGLYRLDTSDYSWDDISGASAPYGVPSGDRWSFCIFGQNLIACNLTDAPQVYDIDAVGTFADLGGSPPKAKYVWSAGDFLVLGHIVNQQKRVQWSGVGDATFWVTGRRGSDYQDLPDGAEVTGGLSGEGGAIVFQRNRIRVMTITQDADFSMAIAVGNPNRGAISPLSICNIGPGQFVYLSEDGFFRNVEGVPIGAERVDTWFFDNLDSSKIEEVRGVADPFKKIVWWRFDTASGGQEILGYNWQLDRWCRIEAAITEMAALATPGITWDGLAALYTTIDEIDEPFDSRLFKGGSLAFAAFNTDNKLCYFTGQNLAATIETADVKFFGDRRAYVHEARVFTDATDFTVKDGVSDFHGGTVTWSSAHSPSSVTGAVHMRHDGLLHRFRVEIAAGADWSHAMGIDATAKPTGKR